MAEGPGLAHGESPLEGSDRPFFTPVDLSDKGRVVATAPKCRV